MPNTDYIIIVILIITTTFTAALLWQLFTDPDGNVWTSQGFRCSTATAVHFGFPLTSFTAVDGNAFRLEWTRYNRFRRRKERFIWRNALVRVGVLVHKPYYANVNKIILFLFLSDFRLNTNTQISTSGFCLVFDRSQTFNHGRRTRQNTNASNTLFVYCIWFVYVHCSLEMWTVLLSRCVFE